MSVRDWIMIACALAVGATGIYMFAAPRRLFMRAEDPAAYRPEAVEYDSPQGVWLRKTAGPLLVGIALIFIVTRFI
jgi:hypothetical protein